MQIQISCWAQQREVILTDSEQEGDVGPGKRRKVTSCCKVYQGGLWGHARCLQAR